MANVTRVIRVNELRGRTTVSKAETRTQQAKTTPKVIATALARGEPPPPDSVASITALVIGQTPSAGARSRSTGAVAFRRRSESRCGKCALRT